MVVRGASFGLVSAPSISACRLFTPERAPNQAPDLVCRPRHGVARSAALSVSADFSVAARFPAPRRAGERSAFVAKAAPLAAVTIARQEAMSVTHLALAAATAPATIAPCV